MDRSANPSGAEHRASSPKEQDKQHSDTLRVGDRAPQFALSAANLAGTYSLSSVLGRGPAIVEFLRGTW